MEPTTVALVVFACGRNGDSAGRERVESTCAVRDVRPCLGTLAERRDNRVRLRTANESGSTFNRGTVRYPGTTNVGRRPRAYTLRPTVVASERLGRVDPRTVPCL